MAAGVPIIASVDSNVFPGIDLGLWPKVRILSGLSTSQLSHEIVDLLNADSVQIKEMQIQQLDFITKNFSVEIVAEKYLSVFRELID